MTRRNDLYYTLGIPQRSVPLAWQDPGWHDDPNREQRYRDSDQLPELLKEHPIMNNKFGRWAADAVADQAAKAAQVVLWDLQEADHAEAFLQGLCTVTFREYRDRLQTVASELASRGNQIQLVRATPADIVRIMDERQLPKDSSGVAAAIGLIYDEQDRATQHPASDR